MVGRTHEVRPTTLAGRIDALEQRGFVMIPDALDAATAARVDAAVDRIHADESAAGRDGPDGSVHALEVLDRDAVLAELLVAPAVLPLVCSALGWNIHLYHSHI